MAVLQRGLLIYHSTIHDFDPQEIKTPCWFSVIPEQSHYHLCYKHFGHPCGRLLTYRLRENVTVADLSIDGYLRMIVNANGNYELANLMKGSGVYNGYKNYQDQAEVMLVDTSILEFISEDSIDLNKKVRYIEKNSEWRMIDENNTEVVSICDSCCVPRRRRRGKNSITPI